MTFLPAMPQHLATLAEHRGRNDRSTAMPLERADQLGMDDDTKTMLKDI
ncbi:MAG: hypothetical protein ACI81L_001468 [Verrucomicrobiales bacterium]|jgi:hypothetical protein